VHCAPSPCRCRLASIPDTINVADYVLAGTDVATGASQHEPTPCQRIGALPMSATGAHHLPRAGRLTRTRPPQSTRMPAAFTRFV
jgi:hypothetical protein